MSQLLALKMIRTNGGTQPRMQLSQDVVGEYKKDMERGDQFPPVTVYYDGTEHWLADGFHRYHAAKSLRLSEIAADVRQGTCRDAILFSVGANVSHGTRRTNADKQRAVLKLLTDSEWSQWSDREIARLCGVDGKTVAALRPKPAPASAELPQIEQPRTVSRGGTTYTMDVAAIGKVSEPEPAIKIAAEVQEPEPEKENQSEPKTEDEEDIDDTKLVLTHLANGLKLIEYYKDWKPQEVARLIDPARRNGAMRKAKRLGKWFKDLGYWLDQGR